MVNPVDTPQDPLMKLFQEVNFLKPGDILAGERVDILEFRTAVSVGKSTFKEATYQLQRDQLKNALDYINGAVAEMNVGFEALQAIVARWRSVVVAQQFILGNIENEIFLFYSASSNMKAAIEQYNSLNFVTEQDVKEYQDKLDIYNAAAEAVNEAFLEFSDPVYNPTWTLALNDIPRINADFAQYGVPPQISSEGLTPHFIAPPELGDPPAEPPIIDNIPDGDPEVIRKLSVTNDANGLFSTYTQPMYSATFEALSASIQTAAVLSKSLSLITEVVSGEDPTLPRAFIRRLPPIFYSASSGQGSASGAGLTTLILGLSSPIMERVLSRSLHEAILLDTRLEGTPKMLDQLQLFTLKLLDEVAKTSAKGTADLLSDLVVPEDKRDKAVDLASALAIGKSVKDLIKSEVIPQYLHQLFVDAPEFNKLSEAEKEKLIGTLAATINLSLLSVSLSITAIALKLPGLISQVVGNLLGSSGKNLEENTSTSLTIDKVLEDPANQLLLKDALLRELAPSRFLPEEDAAINETTGLEAIPAAATPVEEPSTTQPGGVPVSGSTVPPIVVASPEEQLINDVVNSVIVGRPFSNIGELKNAVVAALVDKGIDQAKAESLSNIVSSFVAAEIALPFLNQKFIPPVGIAVGLPGHPIAAAETVTNIRLQRVVDQLIESGEVHPNIIATINELLAGSYDTLRAFRNALLVGFGKFGLSTELSDSVANNIVRALHPPTDEPSGIFAGEGILKRDRLAELLNQYVIDFATPVFNEFKARSLATQFIGGLLGAHGTLDAFNKELYLLDKAKEHDYVEFFHRNTERIVPPPIVLKALKNVLVDTIKTTAEKTQEYMSVVAQTNLLTGLSVSERPSNWKRDLDIMV